MKRIILFVMSVCFLITAFGCGSVEKPLMITEEEALSNFYKYINEKYPTIVTP